MDIFGSIPFEEFMPHGHCYMWIPEILWLHVISDAVITISYYCLPIILGFIAFKIKLEDRFKYIFLLFSLFILACGTTHIIEIINVWQAKYVLAGIVKAFTALISFITMIVLIKISPEIIKLIGKEEEIDLST